MATAVADFTDSQGPDLVEVLAIGRRRRRAMLIAGGAGILLTLLTAFLWPATYRSTATILIEQQELPTELVRSTVTSYADQRVQVISQRVMTTQTLLDIIRRYDLYPRRRERDTREALITRMRDDIGVKMISADVIDPRSGRPTSATIAFSVSFSNRSPDQAAKVANELTTLFLNENLTTRTRLAEDANNFLEGEAQRVGQNISVLETKLAKFKSAHGDELPELMQMNMQLLDRTTQELQQAELKRSTLEQQEVYLEAQLAQLKPNSALFSDSGERILSTDDRLKSLRSQLASARALYAPDHPDIARLQREISGLEAESTAGTDVNDLRRQLEEARGALAQASERYAPDHPDRLRLQKQVDGLQKELASAEAHPRPVTRPTQPDNPAYITIQSQLAATREELHAVDTHSDELHAQLRDYQRKITVSPQIEKEYRELTRDYENARAKYAELRAKQGEAAVARNLESDRKGERFTLIEPALVPQQPVSPNRPLLITLGLVVSIGLAVGAGALLEALDGTVRHRRDLVSLTAGVPALAIVPHIDVATTLGPGWRRLLIRAAAVASVLAVLLAAVHWLYRPLDVIWFVMLRKLGWS